MAARPRKKRDQGSSPSELLASRLRPAPHAVCEAVEEGAVLLHVETGQYYELDPVALFIWRQCTGLADGHAVARRVAAEYGITPETAESDLVPFLQQLLRARLVERAPDENESPGQPG